MNTRTPFRLLHPNRLVLLTPAGFQDKPPAVRGRGRHGGSAGRVARPA